MTLADFLLARIAEDEAAARHADTTVEGLTWPNGGLRQVLAECERNRRIVGLHGTYHECTTGQLHGVGVEHDPRAADTLCPTIRAFAMPYAGHRDYHEEWLP